MRRYNVNKTLKKLQERVKQKNTLASVMVSRNEITGLFDLLAVPESYSQRQLSVEEANQWLSDNVVEDTVIIAQDIVRHDHQAWTMAEDVIKLREKTSD